MTLRLQGIRQRPPIVGTPVGHSAANHVLPNEGFRRRRRAWALAVKPAGSLRLYGISPRERDQEDSQPRTASSPVALERSERPQPPSNWTILTDEPVPAASAEEPDVAVAPFLERMCREINSLKEEHLAFKEEWRRDRKAIMERVGRTQQGIADLNKRVNVGSKKKKELRWIPWVLGILCSGRIRKKDGFVRKNPSAAPFILTNRSGASPRKERVRIGVFLFGLSAPRIERMLGDIVAQCEKDRVFPVFLTDCDHFEVFRRHHLCFEYFPPATAINRGNGLRWAEFEERRLNLLREKWKIDGFVSFGRVEGVAYAHISRQNDENGASCRRTWRLNPFRKHRYPWLPRIGSLR